MNEVVPISIIVSYRDRDISLAMRFFKSLQNQTYKNFKVYLIDYGSTIENSSIIKNLVAKYPFSNYIYSDTLGHFWNKSKALNIGIKRCLTQFILTTDIDIIFPENFLEIILDHIRPDRILYCYPIHLEKNFSNWNELHRRNENKYGNKRMLGSCMCVATEIAKSVQGYDEHYYFWGKEDLDFYYRIISLGLEEIWLNPTTKIFHQWHPRLTAYSNENYIPLGLWGKYEFYIQNKKKIVKRNDDFWGEVVKSQDRQIYSYINLANSTIIESNHTEYLDVLPTNNRALAEFVRSFLKLPSGNALIIDNGLYPSHNRFFDLLIAFVNKLDPNKTGLDYKKNVLHQFINEFIVLHPSSIADYFINYPFKNGITILIKK
jgi:glycosyltransferase involved in cell wall biosynthesis